MQRILGTALASALVAVLSVSVSAAPSFTGAQLMGSWTAHHQGFTFRLVLRPDKTLEWSVDSPDFVDDRPVTGAWRVDGNHLGVLWEMRSDWAKIPIIDVTAATLILDYPLPKTRYARRKLLRTRKTSNQSVELTATQCSLTFSDD